MDPLAQKYPHNSPYAFSENIVINSVELEGLESKVVVMDAVSDNTGTEIIKTEMFWADYNRAFLGKDPSDLPLMGQYGPRGLGELTITRSVYNGTVTVLGEDYDPYDTDQIFEINGVVQTISAQDIEKEAIRQYKETLSPQSPIAIPETVTDIPYEGDGSLVWGQKVSSEFRAKVIQIAK